jgi:cation diffusion facilitator CzcD-associated flavoprotein CzcO
MLSKVMIVGAGTGGLCLAQGLKQFGIDVAVFERDRTPTDRLQGIACISAQMEREHWSIAFPQPCSRSFLVPQQNRTKRSTF